METPMPEDVWSNGGCWEHVWYRKSSRGGHKYDRKFDSKTPEIQLRDCLNGITTRRSHGRWWYPKWQYFDIVLTYLIESELWGDSRDAFIREVKNRVIGDGRMDLAEDEDEVTSRDWYSMNPSNQENVEDRLTIFANWGMTVSMLLKLNTEFDIRVRVHNPQSFCEAGNVLEDGPKFITHLAALSSKSSNFRDLWSEINQAAFLRSSGIGFDYGPLNHIAFTEVVKSNCRFKGTGLRLDDKDLEKVLQKYSVSGNNPAQSPDLISQSGPSSHNQGERSHEWSTPGQSPISEAGTTISADMNPTSVSNAAGVVVNAAQSSLIACPNVKAAEDAAHQKDIFPKDIAAMSVSLKETTMSLLKAVELLGTYSQRIAQMESDGVSL